MTNVIAIPIIGRLGLSRIAFHKETSSKFETVIPLGVIAEIHLNQIHGLGIIARTTLSAQEERMVAPLLRDKLKMPFELLNRDFEWAWHNAHPGQCLADLANRHQGSLRFESPVERKITLKRCTDEAAIMEEARKRLLDARDKEFWAFLREHDDSHRYPPNRGLDELQYSEAA